MRTHVKVEPAAVGQENVRRTPLIQDGLEKGGGGLFDAQPTEPVRDVAEPEFALNAENTVFHDADPAQVCRLLAALLDEAGDEVFSILSQQAVDFVEQVVDLAHIRNHVGGGEGQFLLLLGCGGFGLLRVNAFAAHGSLLQGFCSDRLGGRSERQVMGSGGVLRCTAGGGAGMVRAAYRNIRYCTLPVGYVVFTLPNGGLRPGEEYEFMWV